MKLPKYQPSNSIALQPALLLGAALLLTGLILGVAYAYAIILIPIIYVNVFCTFGVGFLLVWLGDFFSKQFSIQNPMIVKVVTTIVAILAFILGWITWLIYFFYDGVLFVDFTIGQFFGGVLEYLTNPGVIFEDMMAVNEVGTRGIKTRGSKGSGNISGTLLSIIWVLEAFIFIGTPVLMAGDQAKKPFDAQTNTWVDPVNTVHFPLMTANEIEEAIAKANYSGFARPENNEVNADTFTLSVYSLSDGRHYISATKFVLDDGEIKESDLIDDYKEVPKSFIDYLNEKKLFASEVIDSDDVETVEE